MNSTLSEKVGLASVAINIANTYMLERISRVHGGRARPLAPVAFIDDSIDMRIRRILVCRMCRHCYVTPTKPRHRVRDFEICCVFPIALRLPSRAIERGTTSTGAITARGPWCGGFARSALALL